MRTLLIDNYDSFTFNLFQILAEVNGEEPLVVRNNTCDWAEILSWGVDNIVISPGPGRSERREDFGVCGDVLRHAKVPVLGVCLGHQGIAAAAGGTVRHAPVPMHGRLSRLWHDGRELFAGLPQGFKVVRYHSLIVADPLPASLQDTAWSADGLVMGLRHRRRPQWGVQFHPESVATEHGRQLLENFRDLSRDRQPGWRPLAMPPRATSVVSRPEPRTNDELPYGIRVRTLDRWYDPEHVFVALYAEAPVAFWLDSSRVEPELSRFSFVGSPDGPLSHVVSYDVAERTVRVRTADGTHRYPGTLFDFLRARLSRGIGDPPLPFEFSGGYVGYLGYELKADCGGDAAHRSPHPDAILMFADRFVAFDHERRRVHLLALIDDGGAAPVAEAWFDQVVVTLGSAPRLPPPDLTMPVSAVDVRPSTPRRRYLDQIRACLNHLAEGESYEICLTDRVETGPLSAPPFEVYRALRRVNPAPYSAYLRLGDIEVLCSSPERFLRIDRNRWIEAKPIKGTAPRASNPVEDARLAHRLRTDEKSLAENLMIVDLLRNDLGTVSEIGSVHAPKLMAIESYETVHQLVSTIRAQLRAGLTAVDCLQTAFPGGSMTGAPKRRTMQIIDALEGRARGVYSGTIGYLSLNGTADLNIVIRTIVADSSGTSIGTGGAIVAQSDPDAEYEEIVLKAAAPTRAIAIVESPRPLDFSGASPRAAEPPAELMSAEGRRR